MGFCIKKSSTQIMKLLIMFVAKIHSPTTQKPPKIIIIIASARRLSLTMGFDEEEERSAI